MYTDVDYLKSVPVFWTTLYNVNKVITERRELIA